ncbi:uncharacterized protein [Haliaeetus albicilla]
MLRGVQRASAQEPRGQQGLAGIVPCLQIPGNTSGTDEAGQAGREGCSCKAGRGKRRRYQQRRPAASQAGGVCPHRGPHVAPAPMGTASPSHGPGAAAESRAGAPALGGLQGPAAGGHAAAHPGVLVQSEEQRARKLGTQGHHGSGPEAAVPPPVSGRRALPRHGDGGVRSTGKKSHHDSSLQPHNHPDGVFQGPGRDPWCNREEKGPSWCPWLVAGRLGCHFDCTRASEQMGKRVENTAEMGGEANQQNRWRRCWRSLCEMEEWKLTVLLFLSSLSLWGLCTLVLPCTPSLVTILGLGIFMTWWPNIKAKVKGTFAGKRRRSSRRKDPIGSSVPWEGVESSAESLKARSGNPHGGEWWESGYGKEAASAREIPSDTGDVGRRGNSSAASRSGSQPSVANMKELARSLMESLNITQICRNLLQKLNIARDSSAPVLCGAMWEEYPVCLQCRRCLTGSCPHCSQPMAEQDLPTLAVTLCTVDMLVHEEDLQLELGLGFELAINGELLYTWEITQRLPKIAPERCCEECSAPLPRSPGDSKGLRASFPVSRSPGTPAGQMRLGRQDARAAPARQAGAKGGDTSSADLQPARRGESVPTVVPTWPLPPWAQPPPPTALERLRRVGLEPLPLVGYKGLQQGVTLQRIRESWCKVKSSVRESLEPKGTTEADPKLPFHLQFQVDALFHAMAMEA